jgi:nitronate monooxygenase
VKQNSIRTALTDRLGIDYPIIQAPLAGGGDTPELVAAVSNAGGMGFIGAAYLTPDQIVAAANQVRIDTSRPFGVNLFAPLPVPEAPDATAAIQRISGYHKELGLPSPSRPVPPASAFDDQLRACLESGASVFSFTFGLLPQSAVEMIRQRGFFLIGTATTVQEAIALQESGVDAVVTQGSEAGGHRGTFAGSFESAMIGTISLVPQIADAVRVPVIASGGIMDGRGIAAALALGAGAVQMGTAFLTCHESGVPEAYREAILAAHEDQTRITRAFSGRPARGIANRFMDEVESSPKAILPFPWQNSLTRSMRREAAKQGRAEFLSLWAGQGTRLARTQSAADLIQRLARETRDAIGRLQRIV